MSDAPTKYEVAETLGLAGDEFYKARASRGIPSTLTLAMAKAILEKFDVRLRPKVGSGGDNRT